PTILSLRPLATRRPRPPPLFPYTTLFRSQSLTRERSAFAGGCLAAHFQQNARQGTGTLGEVKRRIRSAFQNGEKVMSFQGGPDAPPHRLPAIATMDHHLHAEITGNCLHELFQMIGSRRTAHLGTGPNRYVQNDMGGSRSNLLGQHGSHHLAIVFQVQRPLHPYHDVVRRAQLHGPAPHDTSAFLFHDLPYAFDGKIHWGECFHGVSCSRRRGDGARRSLGNHQPVSRNNRHHQRRCTVPGKPTNTVFVQHHGSPPDRRSTRLNSSHVKISYA